MKALMSRVNVCRTALILVAVLLLAAGSATAIEIQYAIFHPKGDAFSIAEDKWMKAVTERTQGRVTFKPAYAGSLVTLTEAFDAVQSGTVSLALTAVSVLSGKVPDVSAFEPLGYYSEDARYNEMMQQAGPLLEAIFAQHKVVFLWGQPGIGVINVCRNKHTKLPQDYRGVKLRAAGKWQAFQMRALGASPVVTDPGAVFQALQTGTIDCVLFVNNLALSFKLYEPAKFITEYGMPVNLSITLMNPKVFESLSPEDRKIIREVSREVTAGALAPLIQAQTADANKLKALGANLYYLTEAEKKAFREASRGVFDEIRKAAGEQGKKLVDLMAKYR